MKIFGMKPLVFIIITSIFLVTVSWDYIYEKLKESWDKVLKFDEVIDETEFKDD